MHFVEVKQQGVGHAVVMGVLFRGERKVVNGISFIRKHEAVLFGNLHGVGGYFSGKIIRIQTTDDFLRNFRIKFNVVGGEGPVGFIAQDPPVKHMELRIQVGLVFGNGHAVENQLVFAP